MKSPIKIACPYKLSLSAYLMCICRALIGHGVCHHGHWSTPHPPGTIITSCRVWARWRPQYTQCHLWQVSLLRRWFTSTLTQSWEANERAAMRGIIQSGGRDTGSGLTDILNVSKYNRPEVRTSGKLLHWYLVTGSMTTLRIFTILKNMLDQLIVANIQNRFSQFSSFFACFPVHVWVSGAGHSREQMWARPAPGPGVTLTSRVTWLTARDCHAALQSVITQPRHK